MLSKDTFFARVAKQPFGCWTWPGAKENNYGHCLFNGKQQAAHRVAWQLENGPIPDGLRILHDCDNKACVNPAHLYAGTQKQNIQDMVRRKRGLVGFLNGAAKLTDRQIDEIRAIGRSQPQRVTAERFGIDRSYISHLLSNRRRNH